MLQLQQCSSPCILLSIQLEIKNNVHEIKQSSFQIAPEQLLDAAVSIRQELVAATIPLKLALRDRENFTPARPASYLLLLPHSPF